jgi:hypothetical protein
MTGMYPAVLLLHSWLRWFVLVFAVVAVVRAIHGVSSGRSWVPADDRAGKLFMWTLDLQMLVGLVLYFALSPITRSAMSDFGGAMRVSATRFWAVERLVGMVVAIALAHAGHARVRRIKDQRRRHKTALFFFTLALIAVLASIPWPGTPNARPLLRLWS